MFLIENHEPNKNHQSYFIAVGKVWISEKDEQ